MKKTYLKRLELKEYRAFKEFAIDFIDSNVIIILGINGKGKSSILDSIAYNLSFFVSKMYALNLDEIVYESQPVFEDVNLDAESALSTLKFYSFDNEISISTYLNKVETKPEYSYEPKEFIDNFRKFISTYKQEGLPIFAYYRSHRSKVNPDHSSFKGTYDSRLFGNHRAFRKEFSSFTGFESWYSAVHEKVVGGSANSTLEYVNQAILTFLSSFTQVEFTQVRVVTARVKSGYKYDNFRIQILKTNQWINLRSLSSGEKSLIYLVCDIARRLSISNDYKSTSLQGNGIIIIDEIELHLHPSWQRNILSSLSKVFPNIQFVVTTHSPFVVNSIDDAAIYEVNSNKTNGEIEINKFTSSTSNSISYVLEKVFEVHEEFGNKTQLLLDKFYDYRNEVLENNDENAELLLEIAKKLRETANYEIIDRVNFEINQIYKRTDDEKYRF